MDTTFELSRASRASFFRHREQTLPPAPIVVAHPVISIRRSIATVLRSRGEVVIELRNSAEVTALLATCLNKRHELPHFIIAAARAPTEESLNGFELLKSAAGTGWDLPVVVVTDRGDRFGRMYGQILGAVGVYEWPCDPEALCESALTIVGDRTVRAPRATLTPAAAVSA